MPDNTSVIEQLGGPFDIGAIPPDEQGRLARDLFEYMRRRDELTAQQSVFQEDVHDVLERPDLIMQVADEIQAAVEGGLVKLPDNPADPESYPCGKLPDKVFEEKLAEAERAMKAGNDGWKTAIPYDECYSLGIRNKLDAYRLSPKQLEALRLVIGVVAGIEDEFENIRGHQFYHGSSIEIRHAKINVRVAEYGESYDAERRARRSLANIGRILKLRWGRVAINRLKVQQYFSIDAFMEYSDEELDRFIAICKLTERSGKHTYLVAEYGLDYLIQLSEEQFEVLADSLHDVDSRVCGRVDFVGGRKLPIPAREMALEMPPGWTRMAMFFDPDEFPAEEDYNRFLKFHNNDLESWVRALGAEILRLDEEQIDTIVEYSRDKNPYVSNSSWSVNEEELIAVIGAEGFLELRGDTLIRALNVHTTLYQVAGGETYDHLIECDEHDFELLQALSFNLFRSDAKQHGNVPLEVAQGVLERYSWQGIMGLPHRAHVDALFQYPNLAEAAGSLEEYGEIPVTAIQVAIREFEGPQVIEEEATEEERLMHEARTFLETYIYLSADKTDWHGERGYWSDIRSSMITDGRAYEICKSLEYYLGVMGSVESIDERLADGGVPSGVEEYAALFTVSDEPMIEAVGHYLVALDLEKRKKVLYAINFAKIMYETKQRMNMAEACDGLTDEQREAAGGREAVCALPQATVAALRGQSPLAIRDQAGELAELPTDEIARLDRRTGIVEL